MPDGWNVSIHGADALERRIRQFETLLSDLRPFWPLVVPLATSWWKRQFETEGAFAGRPWRQLSPGYSIVKSQLRPGRGLLVYDGDMKRAFSKPDRSATHRSLTLTIDDPKVEFHQEGTARMPARPIVFGSPLPPLAARELDTVAELYVSGFMRNL